MHCDFPKGLDRDSRVKLYVYNTSRFPVDVDDVEISFVY